MDESRSAAGERSRDTTSYTSPAYIHLHPDQECIHPLDLHSRLDSSANLLDHSTEFPDRVEPYNNGRSYLQLDHQIRALTPPPPYRQYAASPSEMAVHQYTARVSSLGPRIVPQFRSLDRRKEYSENQDSYDEYSSDDPDEKAGGYHDYTDSNASRFSEKSFPAPKESGARISYPFPQNRPGGPANPLISYVKNDWRYRSPRQPPSPSLGEDEFCPEGWTDILCSRACRRWTALYLLVMVGLWIWLVKFFGPEYVENSFVKESLNARVKGTYGYFGMNRRVSFAGLTQMEHLDRKLVPGSEVEGAKKRRLIIVGDIHGCVEELNALLDLTNFDSQKDHLIATGDCVSKGPNSPAVLDVLLLNNASCVRGNHEDKILLAHRDFHAPSHQKFISDANPSAGSVPVTLKHGATDDLQLAASLTDDQVRYLASWPLILSLGPISGMGNVSVVHAGLTPGVPLLRQDPVSVMTMRSIDLRNHVPSPRHAPIQDVDNPRAEDLDHKGRIAIKPWTVLWNTWQEMQPKEKRETVVYGHDSKAGVVQQEWSFGLDGGCFNGGKLAALVIEEVRKGDVRKSIVSVPCKDYTAEKVLRPLGEN